MTLGKSVAIGAAVNGGAIYLWARKDGVTGRESASSAAKGAVIGGVAGLVVGRWAGPSEKGQARCEVGGFAPSRPALVRARDVRPAHSARRPERGRFREVRGRAPNPTPFEPRVSGDDRAAYRWSDLTTWPPQGRPAPSVVGPRGS